MIKVTKKYGGTVIEFSPRFSTFEGHLFVFAFPKKLLKHILSEIGLEAKEEAWRGLQALVSFRPAL